MTSSYATVMRPYSKRKRKYCQCNLGLSPETMDRLNEIILIETIWHRRPVSKTELISALIDCLHKSKVLGSQ